MDGNLFIYTLGVNFMTTILDFIVILLFKKEYEVLKYHKYFLQVFILKIIAVLVSVAIIR